MKTQGLITGEEPSPAPLLDKSELDARRGAESGTEHQPRGPVRLNAGLVVFLGAVVTVLRWHTRRRPADSISASITMRREWFGRGSGGSLYDINAQHAFQLRYGRPPNLFFNYPAFALLPFLPLALLPPLAAFIAWTICSVGLLTAAIKSLCYRTGLHYDNWPVLLSVAFMPVASSLGHGQLSIRC